MKPCELFKAGKNGAVFHHEGETYGAIRRENNVPLAEDVEVFDICAKARIIATIQQHDGAINAYQGRCGRCSQSVSVRRKQ